MGHEVIVYGYIAGATLLPGPQFRALYAYNRTALNRYLPRDAADDTYPWLVRGMFALPQANPGGTYRRQIIHLGASLKDDPADRSVWDLWLHKFELLLKHMYWLAAEVQISTDFEPQRVIRWTASDNARAALALDPPQPIQEWQRSTQPAHACAD